MSVDDTNNFFISVLESLEEKLYMNNFLKDNTNIIAIQDNIRKFLIANCKHDLETDYIYIDQEQSQKVIYCTKCMMNL